MASFIKSAADRKIHVTRREELLALIATETAKYVAEGMPPEHVRRRLRALQFRLSDIEAQIALYDRLIHKDRSVLRNMDIGLQLIGARIVAGMNQGSLAKQLGILVSQVSRDEKNAYRGASRERLHRVADALGYELQMNLVAVPPDAANSASPSVRPTKAREGGKVMAASAPGRTTRTTVEPTRRNPS